MKVIRKFFRAAAFFLSPGTEFQSFFEKWHPDLLFATDVYTLHDVKIMRCAKRGGIKTIGMIRSWDNVTSKTLLSFIPDFMIVTSERIRTEAMTLGDVPGDRIFVSGVPHYDRYRGEYCVSKAEFLTQYGFRPDTPTVLFATPSDVYLKENPVAARVLWALGKTGFQILVRPPLVGGSDLGNYRTGSNIAFQNPLSYADFTRLHVSGKTDQGLADALNACDIVITWASTMIIDAVVFNKPVILVGFDASPRAYYRSILHYYDYDHHQFILKSGGVRMARSQEALARLVEEYAKDPKRDEEGRKKIVKEYCGVLDGRAGERLAGFLLQLVTS